MVRLLEELYGIKFRPGEEDTMVWIPLPRLGFPVKSYYNTLRGGGADFH